MRNTQLESRQLAGRWSAVRPVHKTHWVLLVILVGALRAAPAGQEPIPNLSTIPNLSNRHVESQFEPLADQDPAFVAKQARALNAERQKSMVSDTDKLLKLAQELNSDIETDAPDTAGQLELRKIADIEKLARNVKQKMSLSVVSAPTFRDPLPQPIR